jgi:hypothetical protein
MVRALSFTHLWIAGAAAVTTWASWEWVGQGEGAATWALWVGLSTGLGYAVQRAIKHRLDAANMPPLRRAFWDQHRPLMVGGWSLVWAAFTSWHWEGLHLLDRMSWLLTLGVLGLLYAIVPGTRRGLRALPWLKIPLIATAWALATTPTFDGVHVGLFASRWLLIAGLTLPFDVRDLGVDQHRITTLPMTWGATLSLRIAAMLLLASGLCLSLGGRWSEVPTLSAVFLAQSVLAAGLVASPSLARGLREDDEWKREQWTGLVLDGVLWLPLLSAAYDLV